MIQFTTDGVEVTAAPAQLREAREEFEKRKLLHLPELLSIELADIVRRGIEQDGFEEPGVATEAVPSLYRGAYQGKEGQDLRQGVVSELLASRTNDPRLLRFIETVIGSPLPTKCIGRVFRLPPSAEDLPWHTDAEQGGRLAVLSIHLSPVQNKGGRFEMRHADTREVFKRVDTMAFGDAMLLRISPHIEHRITAILGSVPNVRFSGSFVPQT